MVCNFSLREITDASYERQESEYYIITESPIIFGTLVHLFVMWVGGGEPGPELQAKHRVAAIIGAMDMH